MSDAVFFAMLLLSSPQPDLNRLGSDDWHTREAETQRLDNWFTPLLLPHRHDNPEIDARVRWLRVKNLKWCNPWIAEQLAFKRDFGRWVRDWLKTGTTRYELREIRETLACDWSKSHLLMQMMPPQPGYLWFPPHTDNELRDYLHYHWQIAPMPREVMP